MNGYPDGKGANHRQCWSVNEKWAGEWKGRKKRRKRNC